MAPASRKRHKGNDGQPIELAVAAEAGPSPAFGLFPSSAPPAATAFTVYGGKGEHAGRAALVAETATMEWDSRNQLGVETSAVGQVVGEGQGYSVQYLLGVHNPCTNTLTLHSAPLHSLSTSIKALKNTPSAVSLASNPTQRVMLGQAFGTRKAIRNITAAARNKLDHESYGSGSAVQSLLQHAIQDSASSLPTAAAIAITANLERPIPPPNFDAKTPRDVYDMDDVVTALELDSIDLQPLLAAQQHTDRTKLLAFRQSTFINDRLRALIPNRDDDTLPVLARKEEKKLRLLVHLSHLLAFRHVSQNGRADSFDRAKLEQRLGSPAPAIIGALLERYTERQRQGKQGEDVQKSSAAMEIKLLSYLLVVVLKIDSWSTNVAIVANDLSVGSARAQELFRSLGCSILAPSTAERAAMIQSGQVKDQAEARTNKRAVLRVPLEFPRDTRGAPQR